MEPNTWYQIHTNGASSTFARFYEAQTDEGATIFRFEKMAADFVNKITEVFGESDYLDVLGAQGRLAEAIKTGV
jgi:hypothetical protein